MTRLATSWLVYRLTGSALLLGIVGFAGQIPTFLFAPFAGVWVDRLDRRRVLVVTQALAMLQSLALAALTLSRHINIQEIIWLSAFQGLINAFDMPARQAFLVQMVEDKQDLGNAIALNSSMVNLARLIGPSLAGAVIAVSGEGFCFPDRRDQLHRGDCLAAGDAAAGGAMKPARALHARTVKGRLGLRLRLRAGAHHPAAVRDGQPDGLALYCAHADFCRGDLAGRAAHAGFSDGRGWNWRLGFGDIAGLAEDGAGTGQDDPALDRGLWRRA